jgi:hypothetical protein
MIAVVTRTVSKTTTTTAILRIQALPRIVLRDPSAHAG